MAITSTERSSGNSPVSSIIQTPVVQFKNVNILVILVSSIATGFHDDRIVCGVNVTINGSYVMTAVPLIISGNDIT